MSKQEFLQNLGAARRLCSHAHTALNGGPGNSAANGGSRPDAPVWLTPKSVKGFEATDFAELGDDRVKELAAAVGELDSIAKQITT